MDEILFMSDDELDLSIAKEVLGFQAEYRWCQSDVSDGAWFALREDEFLEMEVKNKKMGIKNGWLEKKLCYVNNKYEVEKYGIQWSVFENGICKDIASTWLIVELMRAAGWDFGVSDFEHTDEDGNDMIEAYFYKKPCGSYGYHMTSFTRPICEAALRAVRSLIKNQ